jgi:hypothetical protein
MLVLDAIINKWQDENSTDNFPPEDYIKKEYEKPASYHVQNTNIIALRNVVVGKQKPGKGQLVVYKSNGKVVKRSNKNIDESIVFDIDRNESRELKKQYNLSGSVKGILEAYEAGTATTTQKNFVSDLLSNTTYPYGKRQQFSTKLAETIQRAVRQWKARAKEFKRTGSTERAIKVKEAIKVIQDDLVYDFNKVTINGTEVDDIIDLPVEMLGEGVINFLKSIDPDVNNVVASLQEYIDGERGFTTKTLVDISEFVAYYRPFLEELRGIVERKEIPLYGATLEELRDLVNDVLTKFNTIKSIKDQLRVDQAHKILDSELAEELGLDKKDPSLRDQIRSKVGDDPYSDIENTRTDISTASFWVGPIKDSSDQLLRIVHKKWYKLNLKIRAKVLEYGKDIVKKFESITFKKVDWMAEKHKGKYTGFFISPYHNKAFKEAREDFFKKLWDKYGLSHNQSDRMLQIGNDLSDSELLAYRKEEREWYAENTQALQNIPEIIKDLKDTFGVQIVEAWKKYHKVGRDVEYYKIFRIPSEKWRNKGWDKLSKEQKEQIGEVVREKRAIDLELNKALSKNIDPFRMVQISDAWYRIVLGNKKDLFRRLGKNISEQFTEKVDDVDMFGEASLLRPDGSFQRNIPLRWLEPLEDPDTISTDIVGSLIAYKDMWINFREKMKELPDYSLLEEQIAERNYIGKRNEIKKGIDTNAFKKLRNFLDMNLSEIRKDRLEVDVLGTKINVTKVLDKFAQYIRANNLVNSFFTMGSNFISSKVFTWVEAAVEQHTTKKSYAFAVKEYYKNLPGLMQEWAAKTNQSNNKLRLLLEYSGLTGYLGEMFGDLNLNKLTRLGVQSGLYWGYELGDMFVKSKVVLSVLDNYRTYNGKFYTFQEFERLKTDTDYYSLPSAYDQIHVKHGKLRFEFDETDFFKIIAKAKSLSDAIDGQMSPDDQSAIHQHAVFSLVAIHRNWLFSGIYRRLKKKGYNYMLGTMDEGYYRTAQQLILNTFFSRDRINSIKELLVIWDELKPYQKKAVLRVMYDMALVTFFSIIAVMLNNIEAGDDDDRYIIDAAAYLSNRALLEVSAFVNPGEYINVIRDPFVPARNIEYMMDLLELFNTDEITKGPWEGYSHRERFFYRLLPGKKGLVTTRDPEYANEFLKQKPLKWLY